MATATRAEQSGPTVEHLEGCPANEGRVEVDERPASGREGEAGAVVTIIHCVDCGNESVYRGTKAEREAALTESKPTRSKAKPKRESEATSDGADQGEG